LTGTAPNVTYTPAADYNGSDSFSFKVRDGVADSSPATVTLSVSAVNDAPVAVDGAVTASRTAPGTGTFVATDADGPARTFEVVAQPKKGQVLIDASTGTFSYTPNANAKGSDTFTFRVFDGSLFSNTAKITVTIR